MNPSQQRAADLRHRTVAAPPGERGAAAVELALVMPVLALIVLATLDTASLAGRAAEVQAIASAAGSALQRLDVLPPPGSASSGVNILPAAPPPAIALSDLVALPPRTSGTTRLFWGCRGVPRPGPRGTCPDGSPAAAYAEVRVLGEVRRMVAWPDQLLPGQVEARTMVRLG